MKIYAFLLSVATCYNFFFVVKQYREEGTFLIPNLVIGIITFLALFFVIEGRKYKTNGNQINKD
jgi:hypothetical protein